MKSTDDRIQERRAARARGREKANSAQQRYQKYTDNHPTIHTNRFPLWVDMSDEQKAKWYDPNYRGE